MGTAGSREPESSLSNEGQTSRTDGWTDGRMNERALRRDQIRNGRWSIETRQHPLCRTVSIWPSLPAPALSLPRRSFTFLPLSSFCLSSRHVFRLYLSRTFHILPSATPSRPSFSLPRLFVILRYLSFSLFLPPFSSLSLSFRRIFVAFFPPRHSPSVMLRHIPVVLTSRHRRPSPPTPDGYTELRRRRWLHDSTTLDYTSGRYRERNVCTLPLPLLMISMYVRETPRVVRFLQDRQREHRVEHSRSNLFLLSFLPSSTRARASSSDFFLLRTNDASSRSPSDARLDPTSYLSTSQPGGQA